jgi:hypothetical protein
MENTFGTVDARILMLPEQEKTADTVDRRIHHGIDRTMHLKPWAE